LNSPGKFIGWEMTCRAVVLRWRTVALMTGRLDRQGYRNLLLSVTEEPTRQMIATLLAEERQKQEDAGDPLWASQWVTSGAPGAGPRA